MGRAVALRREEDGHHTPAATLCVEAAQRGEAHTLLEQNDFAHGLHLVAGTGHGETMKCSLFRGDA